MVQLQQEFSVENDIQTTLRRLRHKFIKDLPRRLAALEKLVEAAPGGSRSLDALQRATNRLLGAADSHRLALVAEAARGLERSVAALPAAGEIDATGLHAVRVALANLAAEVNKACANFMALPFDGWGHGLPVVIVDNDKASAAGLRSVLEQAEYKTEVVDGLAALRAACQDQDSLAAIIVDMACLEADGAHIIAELKARRLTGLPVLVLLEQGGVAAKLAAYQAGATRCLAKPVAQEALLQALVESVASMPARPYRVLVVDDDAEQLAAHALILRQAGMVVQTVSDPWQAPEALASFAAETLVLAMAMRQCSGPALAAILCEEEQYKQMPVIYLTTATGMDEQLLALERGNGYFLAKPVHPRHLVAAASLHARRFRQAHDQAEDLRVMLYEWKRQHQAVDVHAIVSVTDAAGRIVYVNDKFCEISGYSRKELLGSNHRILKSGEHPDRFFADMWRAIARGKIWQGDVCNRRKDGSLYWVKSSIVPFLDANGSPYQYISIRTDITRIKQAERRLNVLERAVEASSGSISIADASSPDLPLVYVNPAFERITGYKREEAIGLNSRFLQRGDRDQQELIEIRAALREGRAAEALLRNYRKDGSLFWNKMRIAPVHDEQGKLSHFIGITDDVTQQREAEASLQEALDRLQKIASRVPGAVYQFRMHPDGRYCFPFISNVVRDMFGVNPEDVREDANQVFAVVHPDDYQGLMASIEASGRDLTPWEHEFRVQFGGGAARWLFGNSVPEREADGAVLWHGFITDITCRKNADRALKESSKHTQAILDNVVDGVIAINGRGIILSVNPAAQRIFGYAAEEIIGKNINLLMPEPYRGQHNGYLKNYQHTGVKHIIGIGREVAGQRKDGGVFPMDLAVSELELEDETLFIGLVRDISIRKRHEAELLVAKEEAERASLAKSRFLSSMSHELRTPMNAVLGFSQLMEMDAALPQEHQENVGEILKAGNHLMELINEVLDLAKIESGNIELSIEAVAFSDVVAECLTLVRPMANARGIRIACSDFTGVLLRADYLRLKQGLLNLLSNAIKYNRQYGYVRLTYERVNGGRVRIKIGDTGPGIPKELIGELFQPFNRLGAERLNIPGTGIGLIITRQLIELMGGSIGVESMHGKGCTFWIELPLETKATASSATLAPAAILPEGRLLNVLYIDDNPSNLKQIIRLLSERPHIHLMTAHTSQIGLDLVADTPFDLILLDINMPDMNGKAFLHELRGRRLGGQAPVVALTANNAPRDIDRGLAMGFAGYLTKPIDAERFFSILDAL